MLYKKKKTKKFPNSRNSLIILKNRQLLQKQNRTTTRTKIKIQQKLMKASGRITALAYHILQKKLM
jgi:hypothetical protein